MQDVFISHAAEDKQVADAVCARLEARGIRCWIAPRDVQPGAVWAEAISKAIAGSRAMVLVFSDDANRSPQVLRELGLAVDKRVDILPFRIDDVEPAPAVGFYIGTQHWLDALTPPLAAHIESLGGKVERLLGRAVTKPAPPPRPSRRRRWIFGGALGLVVAALAIWALSPQDPEAPVPTAPTRSGLIQRLKDLDRVMREADWSKAVGFFVAPPGVDQGQMLQELRRVPEELESRAIAFLEANGEYGPLLERFSERGRRWAERAGVPPEECWAIGHGNAEVAAHWNGREFLLIRLDDVR